jgi:hypothetical protein
LTKGEKVSCTVQGCQKSFASTQNMTNHVKAVHEKVKTVLCTFEGCPRSAVGNGFPSQQDMQRHAASVHRQEDTKTVLCSLDGCGKLFYTNRSMKEHFKRHSPRVKCEHCSQEISSGEMKRHVDRVHKKMLKVMCNVDGCAKMFFDHNDMRKHANMVHLNLKPHKCSVMGCEKSFAEAAKLRLHMKSVHYAIRDIHCTVSGCKQPPFSDRSNMLKHVRTMHEFTELPCSQEGCSRSFKSAWKLEFHHKRAHNVKGQQAQIKKQHTVHNLLKHHFTVDDECHIRYSGVVPKPDKFCAFVDFHITSIVDHIVMVECDEYQHEGYLLPCEQSRMVQIAEAVQMKKAGGVCQPIVFVRYNCDNGKFNNVTRRNMTNRKAALIDFLASVQKNERKYTDPVNIVYINYDAYVNENGEVVAEVTEDPEFVMQGVVKDVIVTMDDPVPQKRKNNHSSDSATIDYESEEE